MEEWKHFEITVDGAEAEMMAINDYYECLIECTDGQSACKKICREVLTDY
jgi:hypothetical protein